MSETTSPQKCYLCSHDLFFTSRIVSTAKSLGLTVQTIDSPAEINKQQQIDCLLIDLSVQGLDIADLLAGFPAAHRPIVIAFGAHVQGDKLKAAQQAGCDVVLTKNQFTNQLPNLLQQHCIANQHRA